MKYIIFFQEKIIECDKSKIGNYFKALETKSDGSKKLGKEKNKKRHRPNFTTLT